MDNKDFDSLKQTGTMVVAMIIFMMLIILAVVGTGIYLAVHNWG